MAMSPRVSPPRYPAALAAVLLANQAVAGRRTVPPIPRRFIKVRLPSCKLELAVGVSSLAQSAASCVEPSWIGLFCIFYGSVLILASSLRSVPDRPITQNIPPGPEIICWGEACVQVIAEAF